MENITYRFVPIQPAINTANPTEISFKIPTGHIWSLESLSKSYMTYTTTRSDGTSEVIKQPLTMSDLFSNRIRRKTKEEIEEEEIMRTKASYDDVLFVLRFRAYNCIKCNRGPLFDGWYLSRSTFPHNRFEYYEGGYCDHCVVKIGAMQGHAKKHYKYVNSTNILRDCAKMWERDIANFEDPDSDDDTEYESSDDDDYY